MMPGPECTKTSLGTRRNSNPFHTVQKVDRIRRHEYDIRDRPAGSAQDESGGF